MQTSKQTFSSDFVYLLHAAVPSSVPQISPEVEDDDVEENEEDVEDDGGLREIDFDD